MPSFAEEIHIISISLEREEIPVKKDALQTTQDPLFLFGKNYYSIGLHPWFSPYEREIELLQKLEKLSLQSNVLAIGECGLDKLKGGKMSQQIDLFKSQITIAETCNKPLVLHIVKGWSELFEINKNKQIKVPLIIHGFRGKAQLAEHLLAKGFYLSFGQYAHNEAIQLAFNANKLFLETDDSFLSIKEIYTYTANVLGITIDDLKKQIFSTSQRIGLLKSIFL